MAYNVRIMAKAESDLDSFVKYLSKDLMNSNAALQLLDDFLEQKSFLVDSPYMFPLCPDLRLQNEGYHRFIFYKNFIALYLIEENEDKSEYEGTVSIMRLFYAKRDYGKLV